MLSKETKWLSFFIVLAVLVNFSGLFVPLMDPDAGVYASISKNMVLRSNYLELYFQGTDWLDKPHFPFWITALFFKIFGIHDWSYKLPGILFSLLAAWYTWLFAKKYYDRRVALWAVFILLTAEHFIISNNDVRAEPFLMALIIASIYHFSKTISRTNLWQLVAGAFFAGCAVMTKGPFTLMPVGAAIAGELIIKRKWKELFHWRWLLAGVLIGIFIIPELYSLWYQFDRHPGKKIVQQDSQSGIKFFLWDSQFGRFLSSGNVQSKGNPFFFLHTLLWAFLPWSLLMYAALFQKIRNGIKKTNPEQEWFTLSGSLLTILVFSLSKFQLPYYTNIIFPLLAVLTANFIVQLLQANSRSAGILQSIITYLLLIGTIALHFVYRPAIRSPLLMGLILCLTLLLITLPYWLKITRGVSVFLQAGLICIALNLYLNWFFYPDLLKYQSSSEAAFYMNAQVPATPVMRQHIYAPVLEFYLEDSLLKPDSIKPGTWYVTEEELAELRGKGIQHTVIKELPEFHVTMLTWKFVNRKTRHQELKKYYLVRIS